MTAKVTASSNVPSPGRGEIWFVQLPSDPLGKLARPVVVISHEARNKNPRANTILVVPLSTTLREPLPPTHIRLQPGETGLAEISELQAENINTVRKESLRAPRQALRRLGEPLLRRVAARVIVALGFHPENVTLD